MGRQASFPDEAVQPLAGRHVLITRPIDWDTSAQDSLEQQLRRWGARVSVVPMVTIQSVPFAIPQEDFDWLFFTSKNGVRAFFEAVPAESPLCSLPVAVVGPATGQALLKYREPADFVSPQFDAEGAAEAFRDAYLCQGMRVLWPCGNLANRHLAEALRSAGAEVAPLIVYETTLRETLAPDEAATLQAPADMLVFTSPSAVTAYSGLKPPNETDAAIACLGPKTRQEALAVFGRVDVQAESSTLDALAEAIKEYYTTLIGTGKESAHGPECRY